MADGIVIVGASLAGLRAAETLRREAYSGPITIVGDESVPPYDRPPLSKQVLAGEWEADRVELADENARAELDADWILGRPAVGLDVDARTVSLADGRTVTGGDGVLIATGARCRELPGTEDRPQVRTLRTLDDCIAIAEAFDAGARRVVVVGAGFIGAEVAATARERGLDVTMVEAGSAPMERAVGTDMGLVLADIHRDHGVDVRLETGVDEVMADGDAARVLLSDGTELAADIVVVGIGVVPNVEWLDGSGLTLDDGVVCDETTLAAPGIVAAGDVARWPNPLFGGELSRVEHWNNAVEMGVHAAKRLLGNAEPYAPVPWFWSDQYDRKIQLAGHPDPTDDFQLVTGSIAERRFAGIYGRDGRFTGILGVNRPRHVMQYRRLLADSASWDDAIAFSQE